MQHITIGTKNQIVIPKEIRKKILGMQPGKKVSIYAISDDTVAIKVPQKSWAERSYGALKKIWKTTQPTQQLEQIRGEWDEK